MSGSMHVAEAPSAGRSVATPPAAPVLSVLRWDHERQVAALLARAFVDDPLVTAICDAPADEREQRMGWGFRVTVRSHCLAAQPAWTVVDNTTKPVGVVLVTRSRTHASPLPHAPSDFLFALRGFLHVGLGVGRRGFKAAQIIAAHAPNEPFTYLRTLGVDPQLQGRGLGSRLMDQVLRTAPRALPIYLETAKQGNLAFYARHDFRCIGEFQCLGVPVWRLIRAASG